VLFGAAEFNLPIAGDSHDVREHLFALDPAPQPTIARLTSPVQAERLPKSLSYFAVSPDEDQVLFGADNGEVWLLTLSTGAVEPIAPKIDGDKNFTAPVWRRSGEFSYLKKAASAAGNDSARPVELVLRRGKTESILSGSWPDETLRRLID
ncbi:MAG: hypothetical protein HY736_09315, partial [Verrucomicrobia bacterium]|nr:hypothetical protein [Verrucomicrobiota bacterium]